MFGTLVFMFHYLFLLYILFFHMKQLVFNEFVNGAFIDSFSLQLIDSSGNCLMQHPGLHIIRGSCSTRANCWRLRLIKVSLHDANDFHIPYSKN